MKRWLFTLLAAVLMTGCAAMAKPQAPRALEEQAPVAWSAEKALPAQKLEGLLELTPDEQLRDLVQRALAGNPGLAQMALRYQEAESLVHQIRAEQLPTFAGSVNGSRVKQAGQARYAAGLTLNWEVDLWRRLGNATNASRLERQALAGDLAAARISLVGQVMKSWLELVSQRRILQLEEARIGSLATAEKLIAGRYRNGLVSIEDLNVASSAKATSAANLSQQQDIYQRTQRRLKTLLGEMPDTDFSIPSQLPGIQLPAAGLPAETIGRRPDLRATYQRIQAADLKTKVAYKSLLPGFRFSFDLRNGKGDFSELLKGSPAWTLLGSLTTPLFNAGKLRAELKRSDYAAQRSFLDYRKLLLKVILEVENAMASEKLLARQQTELASAQRHAEVSFRKYQHLYREGMTDILSLLVAERTTYQARIRRITSEKERLANRVDLALALGVGI